MKKEDKMDKTEELKKGIISILLFFIFPLLYQLSLYYLLTHCNNIIKSLLLLIGEIILTTILVIIQKDKFKNAWQDFKNNKKEYLDLMFKYWVLGFIIMIVSNLFINVILQNGIAANESTNRSIIKTLYLYAIPAIILLGPINEELAFRIAFKRVFKSSKLFIIVTSLLFASAHIFGNISSFKDILYLIPYGSLGAAMGYVYYKTDNVLTNIFMHMFHNSLSVLAIISVI